MNATQDKPVPVAKFVNRGHWTGALNLGVEILVDQPVGTLLYAAPPPQALTDAEERIAFEKWSDSVGLFRGFAYDDNAWAGWQARALLKAQP